MPQFAGASVRSACDVAPIDERGRASVNTPPILMTIREFCACYRLGRTRAYELIKSGAVVAIKVGRSTRITVESAEAWFRSLPPVVQ